MARPAKTIAVKTGVITKQEEKQRLETENILKGGTDKLKPPEYLTGSQAAVFNFVLTELDEAKILGNLDIFALSQLAICVDRIKSIEDEINQNKDLLISTKFMQSRDRYARDFIRLCNEFCMSPQSRAKLSISAVKATENKKTLMDLLNEDDDEDD